MLLIWPAVSSVTSSSTSDLQTHTIGKKISHKYRGYYLQNHDTILAPVFGEDIYGPKVETWDLTRFLLV